jgi:hypothetical protein
VDAGFEEKRITVQTGRGDLAGIVGEQSAELVLAGWERVRFIGEVAAAIAEVEVAATQGDADVVPLAVGVEVFG